MLLCGVMIVHVQAEDAALEGAAGAGDLGIFGFVGRLGGMDRGAGMGGILALLGGGIGRGPIVRCG